MKNKKRKVISIDSTEEGKFQKNMKNLGKLMCKVNDKKELVVICIAGIFRSGKSFMLNFFIRYLREKGWENSNWFGDDDQYVQDGFQWERGHDGITEGINIWPEIYEVQLPGENKIVNVMHVDTQGLFDVQFSIDLSTKIMSLSAIMSSHLILNCSNKLDERDLEHLQVKLCVAYSKGVTDDLKQNESLFQKLTYLIRDWKASYMHVFDRQGGTDYVDKILGQDSRVSQVAEVKKAVETAFKSVHGFLMPQPNDNICGEKKNADVHGKFREYTIQLVEQVLHPKHLVVKKTLKQPQCAKSWLNLVASVSSDFENDSVPRIPLLELQNNSEILTADALIKHKEIALEKAETIFLKKAKVGQNEQKGLAWDHAKQECENSYNSWKDINDINKGATEMLLRNEAKFTREEEMREMLNEDIFTKEEIYRLISELGRGWTEFARDILGISIKKQRKLLGQSGVMSKNVKLKMLMYWKNKQGCENAEELLIRLVEEFTGMKAKSDMFRNRNYRFIGGVLCSVISDEQWMKFARLKLQLKNKEIEKLTGKFGEFSEEMKYQMLKKYLCKGTEDDRYQKIILEEYRRNEHIIY